jgi:hypothetical protein
VFRCSTLFGIFGHFRVRPSSFRKASHRRSALLHVGGRHFSVRLASRTPHSGHLSPDSQSEDFCPEKLFIRLFVLLKGTPRVDDSFCNGRNVFAPGRNSHFGNCSFCGTANVQTALGVVFLVASGASDGRSKS